MYKLLSTGMQKFYREYTWKASTAKVSPSKTYPLYGTYGTRRFYREYTWKASTAKVSPSETYPLYGT